MPFPQPVLATVPRMPLSPPVPLPYPGPPGNAGEPRRLTLVALFGSPLPGIPLGSPKPPVCTLFTGATTVAGAALPDPRLPTFTSSFGRFGCVVGVSIFTCWKTALSSTGFASKVFFLGGSAFAARKTCVCLGFSLTGSGTTGFGFGGGTLAFTLGGGGGGGGATGISVIGCINSTTRKFKAVVIRWGKSRGIMSKKPKIASCPAALKPMPIVVLRGGSASMVVIRVRPREISGLQTDKICLGVPSAPKSACRVGTALQHYQSTDEAEGVRIGLWY